MTDVASNMVHNELPELAADNDIAGFFKCMRIGNLPWFSRRA
jgi:hypothetical protein